MVAGAVVDAVLAAVLANTLVYIRYRESSTG
jgi:hypothetical protein